MLRYAITDSQSYDGNQEDQLVSLVRQTAQWAASGMDLIQIREKHLAAGALADVTRKILAAIIQVNANTQVLVNSRADVAVATGAHGVHLTAAQGELPPAQVRKIYLRAGRTAPILSASCHTLEQVQQAALDGINAILFGPVFGKSQSGVEVLPGVGLDRLREACIAAGQAKVFALGGVTEKLAAECVRAGAAGVAAIRLFQSLPRE